VKKQLIIFALVSVFVLRLKLTATNFQLLCSVLFCFMKVFAGWMQSELQCMHCDHCSRKVEPFLDISLSLDLLHTAKSEKVVKSHTLDGEICEGNIANDGTSLGEDGTLEEGAFSSQNSLSQSQKEVKVKPDSHDESITLDECLQHYTSTETLSEQVQCDACKQHRPSRKRLTIATTPKVLILHFKRFDSLRQLKICSKVNFPLRGLDLAPFMQQQQPSQCKQNIDDKTPSSQILNPSGIKPLSPLISKVADSKDTPLIYDLQGLISHKGSLTQVSYDFSAQFYLIASD
jgi:ubiquitin C-terminal hydrolase